MTISWKSNIPRITHLLGPAADDAVEASVREMKARAQALVPVESGALRNSIEVERVKEGEWKFFAGNREVYYAALVEFGSSRKGARPYFIPAVEAVKGDLDDAVRDALRRRSLSAGFAAMKGR